MFDDGTQECCDILVDSDGINSPDNSKFCEFNVLILELWNLIPKSTPNDPENFQLSDLTKTISRY
ncbi:5158_t:CDS:2 [Funneliformis caledonium]|uniref:5158_t:CDS:1 n=1 Tax=Funneliformis caledonium TaxID=1117310 RepID=A0A9N9F6X9_9GLOM|nr:5158_t:CDS:2 [Funneliformis caledonium]